MDATEVDDDEVGDKPRSYDLAFDESDGVQFLEALDAVSVDCRLRNQQRLFKLRNRKDIESCVYIWALLFSACLSTLSHTASSQWPHK